MLFFITLFSFFICNACRESSLKIISIQPLGEVSKLNISIIKKSIKTFYGYDCIVLPKKDVTNKMLSKVTKRIDANKILQLNNKNGQLLFLTEKDICHFKDKYRPEYGIFGLGLIKSKTCVISTFRLKKNASPQIFTERLKKVALHEIGHNLGLNHCNTNKLCLMHDAKGTIKQVDLEMIWLCDKCRNAILKS